MSLNRILGMSLLAIPVTIGVTGYLQQGPVSAAEVQAPRFEVDPLWPKPLPNHWIVGQVTGVSVDAQDHIWIAQHPGPDESHSSTPAPPVLEFDEAGNLVSYWNRPGAGTEWPEAIHGITVDYRGNVWISGNNRQGGGNFHDSIILKFGPEQKFLLQIGKPGQSKGSGDTENLRLPAKMFVDKTANEVFVADGYGNHRVIVYDAETGAYKRHWGAYGHAPSDASLGAYNPADPPAQQFRNPVHCAELSKDRLLYVCDRDNDRIQIFKPDGTFVKEVFIKKQTRGEHGTGSVWDLAFSPDAQQKYIYIADGENDRIHVLDRQTLEILTNFGDGGRQPGEFHGVHSIATDSKGNIFTTETRLGQRFQKFAYKGVGPVTKKEQGVLWPTAKK